MSVDVFFTVFDKYDKHYYFEYFRNIRDFSKNLKFKIIHNYNVNEWDDYEVVFLESYEKDFEPIDRTFITIIAKVEYLKYKNFPKDLDIWLGPNKSCNLLLKCCRIHGELTFLPGCFP